MDRIEETQARINMYGLLSRLLIEELDVETLNRIKNTPEFLELFPRTKEWEKLHSKDTKKLIEEDLNVDFTTVFLLNVYPYESVFMHDEGHIDPTATNQTFLFYREHGYSIDLNKTRALSPDHIAVEMEFMMTLAQEELKAIESGNEKEIHRLRNIQKQFLEEHLLNWGIVYLLAAKDMAETPFYQDLCELSLEFLLSDYEYLCELQEEGASL
ncbi:TorD/DmsD family molecular chaperone [Persephonella sp.]